MNDSKGEPEAWWFNLKTHQVEFGRQSHAKDRMGPYATREDAKLALDIARNRVVAWDREDED